MATAGQRPGQSRLTWGRARGTLPASFRPWQTGCGRPSSGPVTAPPSALDLVDHYNEPRVVLLSSEEMIPFHSPKQKNILLRQQQKVHYTWSFLKFALIATVLLGALDWTLSAYERKTCNCACSCNQRSRARNRRHCLQSPQSTESQPSYVMRPLSTIRFPEGGNDASTFLRRAGYPGDVIDQIGPSNPMTGSYRSFHPAVTLPRSSPVRQNQESYRSRDSPPPPPRRRSQRLIERTQSSMSY
ncbi:hypothetical protein GE061_011785 [Apolygus lucorum]|uniref:Uncharacterized protein n=1 Tax=Apolygus lucorum TaxID=248454 RepID=A0A8S9XZP6_APOLU|nr:hypothetical protein GE061_011785 [Apolygus lucorum]